jgi:predicted TIM-barrel fold metal-dependent hydrolase
MTDRLTIDTHCHIASLDFIPPSFVDGLAANVRLALASRGIRANADKITQMFLTKFQDKMCDELVAEMDEAGVDKAVLLAADFTYAVKDCRMSIADVLAHHRVVMNRHPGRFFVFAGVDPRWGRDGTDLFELSILEYGFHGFKVYPPCGFGSSDRSLYPYYEMCARWRLPVLIHVGGTCPDLAFDTASAILVDQAARDFPRVNFILAHGSVSYVEECAMMAAFRPNVYIDVSGFQTADLAMLAHLFGRNVNHKILFGTDWPFFRLQGSQKECLDKLRTDNGPMERLRDHEEDAFMGGTIDNILKMREPALANERHGVEKPEQH